MRFCVDVAQKRGSYPEKRRPKVLILKTEQARIPDMAFIGPVPGSRPPFTEIFRANGPAPPPVDGVPARPAIASRRRVFFTGACPSPFLSAPVVVGGCVGVGILGERDRRWGHLGVVFMNVG